MGTVFVSARQTANSCFISRAIWFFWAYAIWRCVLFDRIFLFFHILFRLIFACFAPPLFVQSEVKSAFCWHLAAVCHRHFSTLFFFLPFFICWWWIKMYKMKLDMLHFIIWACEYRHSSLFSTSFVCILGCFFFCFVHYYYAFKVLTAWAVVLNTFSKWFT